MSKVTPLNVMHDRVSTHVAMFESMKDELRSVLHRYYGMQLHQVFINEAFAEVSHEAHMGPAATILDGDEPA